MGDLIEIRRDHVTSQEVKKICDDLKNDAVQALTLREVSIADKDYNTLLKHVESAQHIRHLSLSVGMVTDGYRVRLLATCVQKTTSLTGMFLHGNMLGDAGVQVLQPALKSHPGIVSLDVGDCGVGDEGLELLCGLLPASNSRPGIREMVLSSNPAITAKGWAKLGLTMLQGTSVRLLYVDYNKLTDVSACCLLMGVAASPALEALDMECTGVTDATGQMLLNLLDKYPNMNLQSVNLTENDISKTIIEAITLRLPGLEDSSKMLDYNSDEDQSLTTSEPPLDDDDDLTDDISEVGENNHKVHPTTVSVVGCTGENTEATVERDEVTNTNIAGPEKASSRGAQSLADRIKITRPSSATPMSLSKETDTFDETCLKSISAGYFWSGNSSTLNASNKGTDAPPTKIRVTSNDTDITQDTTYHNKDNTLQSGNAEHSLGLVLIPETPSVVSLHQYHQGSRGQDDESFQPMQSHSVNQSSKSRPRSAPIKDTLKNMQSRGSPRRPESSDNTLPGPVMAQSRAQKQSSSSNKHELQVTDTRRRLSCGSVLPNSLNKHLSAGTNNLHTFTKSHSLQTSDQGSTDSHDLGSQDNENVRRRLSNASIQPMGYSDNLQSTSDDSNNTLGDMQLEELI